ncbi:hypothetical protein IMSAG049_00151 [Clostridiales bacterium]|nr:hypothetical protein IMSAG049_00151 [Clostridiales bacterium]
MSDFRILKGNSINISTSKTPFHDGWCYFTSDDGSLYIDTITNDENKRVKVGTDKSNSNDYILSKTNWSSKQQTLTIK